MYVAVFSSIFVVLFALFILSYLDINYKISEYVKQFEEGNKIILNKLADVRDDVDTMNIELKGEVSMLKNKMNSHNSGHVNSEKVKKDIKQWNDSIKQNEKTFKTMNSKIDSMGMFINNFDEELNGLADDTNDKFDELDDKLSAFGTGVDKAFRQIRDDTDDKLSAFGTEADKTFRQIRDDTGGALESVGTVLEEIDDRLDRYDDNFDYINKELSK
jgi:chromosome segregation ATPase